MTALLLLLGPGCAHTPHTSVLGLLDLDPWNPPPEEFNAVSAVVDRRQEERDGDRLPFATQTEITTALQTHGFADLHAHALSDEGFGLRAVAPGPGPCEGTWHGMRPPLMKVLVGLPDIVQQDMISDMLPHCPTSDVPSFDGWTHEQFSLPDLIHAREYGLRMIVMYAVNNALLCAMSQDYTHRARESCADQPNIERQLAGAWDMARRHPEVLRVVTDPLDAVQVLAEPNGPIGAVLGIEASNYFDFRENGGIMNKGTSQPAQARARRDAQSPGCDPAADPQRPPGLDGETGGLTRWTRNECGYATEALHHAARLGARAVFPVHEWNSVMGGAAFQHLPIFQPGYSIIQLTGVPERLTAFTALLQFAYFSLHATHVSMWPMPGEIVRDRETDLEFTRNLEGLTPMGRAFDRAAMDEGVMLDVTHYSERSLGDLMSLIDTWTTQRERQRPMLLASHVTSRTVTIDTLDDFEFLLGGSTLEELASYGRIVLGLRTPTEPSRPVRVRSAPGGTTVSDCLTWDDGSCVSIAGTRFLAPGDSRSLWQAYAYLGSFGAPLAFGTDMNGGATQTAPRACVRETEEARAALATQGTRTDLTPFLHPCPGLAPPQGTEGPPSSYVRGGLSSVAALPHLLADLGCVSAGDQPDDVSCQTARLRSPPMGPCETPAGQTNPICWSAADFTALWIGAPDARGRVGRRSYAVDVESVATPGDRRITGTGRSLPPPAGAPPRPDTNLDLPIPEPAVTKLDSPHPVVRFAGSAGEWVMIDREAQRKYNREIRWPGFPEPECLTLDEYQRRHAPKRRAREEKAP